MRQPSFFIVGAPKCGTTALCKYLSHHPEVFIPPLKELNYFDADLKTKNKASSPQEYLAIFSDGKGKVCGEGSPTYLYSKIAAKKIYAFNPESKIIIMLRNPVDMMYSFHSQHLFNGSSETVQDFAAAIELESRRKMGFDIPARCAEPQILFYRDFARYATQVERYLKTFDRANIKILLFEEFKHKTEKIFQETLDFLGVDSSFRADLAAKNTNKRVRSVALQRLIKYPPSPVLSWGKYLLPMPQTRRRLLLEAAKLKLKKLNTQKVARQPLDPAVRRLLTQELKPDIIHLELLIEQDLSHWYRPSNA